MKKMLKFRLPISKSEKYVKWLKKQNPSKDFHHVVSRKATDYIGVLLTREEHVSRHSNMSKYFEEDLLKAIENLILYVKHLEE